MDIKNKKILITGGTGFIGSVLAKKLAPHNKVVIVDRRKPISRNDTTFVKMDILSKSFPNFIKKGKFDYFFHLAGNVDLNTALERPEFDFESNLLATFGILDTLRTLKKRPRFIFASTAAVYGDCGDSRLNENTSLTVPLSNYGVAKLAGERYVYVFSRQYGVPAISLRVFPTYGPGLRRQVVYDFIRKLDNDPRRLEILGDGTQGRDFVFVEDQAENIVRVASRARYKGEVYNLCSGKTYTTREIAGYVAKAMGLRPKLVFTKKKRVFDGQRWSGDDNKIKKMGCKIAVPMKEGIKITVDWYRENIKN